MVMRQPAKLDDGGSNPSRFSNLKAIDTAYLSKKLYEIYDQELDILERDHKITRSHVSDLEVLPNFIPPNWLGKKTFYIKIRALNSFKKVVRDHWKDFNRRYPKSVVKFK